MSLTPTPDNTAVETPAVKISVLTVGARSMTQGMFRQLVEQRVINAAGRIDGTPWGYVNYHPERCEDAKPHLHVVWQVGGELRRALVQHPERAYLELPLAGEYAMARIAEGGTRSVDSNVKVYRDAVERGRIYARVNLHGVTFIGSVSAPFLHAWERASSTHEELARLEEHYAQDFGARLRPSTEVAELLPVDAYKTSWRALTELPQLFIGR